MMTYINENIFSVDTSMLITMDSSPLCMYEGHYLTLIPFNTSLSFFIIIIFYVK